MCLKFNSPTKQGGYSLPIAVFILVIMALLAAAIVQLSSRNNLSSAQEVFSTRAFYAAESGASWAMSRLLFNTGSSVTKADSDIQCGNPVNGKTINFTPAGLAGCSATLSCSVDTVGSTGYYSIVSTGVCGAGQVQATRVVEVGARNGP